MEHTEGFENLVCKGLVMVFNLQARPCPSTAVLRAAVKLLETGNELRMLTLEHLDIAVDGERTSVAIGEVGRP